MKISVFFLAITAFSVSVRALDNVDDENERGMTKLNARNRLRKDRFLRERETLKHQEDNKDPRKLKEDHHHRALQSSTNEQCFAHSYCCINAPKDFVFVAPTQFNNPAATSTSPLGQSIVQYGGCFECDDIFFDERKPVEVERLIASLSPTFQTIRSVNFAGTRQPVLNPQRDPGYFLTGQCTTSAVSSSGAIAAHSCLLNLCLGGGGYNCLGIYAGTAFAFKVDDFSSSPDSTRVPTASEKNFVLVPALPPAYPGSIIGGTGAFAGARGTVDIITITGTTGIIKPVTTLPTRPPGVSKSKDGFITQKINVVANVPLPIAP